MSSNKHEGIDLQAVLGYRFFNRDLLKQALTHKSYAIEHRLDTFNERLEFLGDSILSAVVVEYLYTKYPDRDEGKLSQIKSLIVSQTGLVVWSKKIKLGQHILLSQGEEAGGGRKKPSILANVLEALIGAMYLDQGYEKTRRFILKYLSGMKRIVDTDYKSRVQEMVQQGLKSTPEYVTVRESGPDHDKRFKIALQVKNMRIGTGTGRSKKEAEQAAARAALRHIRKRGLPGS